MNTIISLLEIISSIIFSFSILINFRKYILPLVGWWAYNHPFIIESFTFLLSGESEFSSKTHLCILLFNTSLFLTILVIRFSSFYHQKIVKESESLFSSSQLKKNKRFRNAILISGITLFILNIFANGIQDLFVTTSIDMDKEYTRTFIGKSIQSFLWAFTTINLIYSLRIKWNLGSIIFGSFLIIDFIGGDRTYPLLFGSSLVFIYSSNIKKQIKKLFLLKINYLNLFLFISITFSMIFAAIYGKFIYTITGLTFINITTGQNEWDFLSELLSRFDLITSLKNSESYHIAGILDKTINFNLYLPLNKIIDPFLTIFPFSGYLFGADSRWYPWLIKETFFSNWDSAGSSPGSSFIGHFYSFGGYIGILFAGIILPIIWEFISRTINRVKNDYLSSSSLLIYSYWSFYIYRNSIDVMVAHTKKTIIVAFIGFIFCYLYSKIRFKNHYNEF